MNITVNGEPRELEGESLSVTELKRHLDLEDRPVLVELNGEAVLAREFDGRRVRDGDVVEIVRMVAGG